MTGHWWDLAPLALIALLFFGPKRLPEMGASIGKTIKAFQHSIKDTPAVEAPTPPTLPKATALTATPELPASVAPSAPVETPALESAGAESLG